MAKSKKAIPNQNQISLFDTFFNTQLPITNGNEPTQPNQSTQPGNTNTERKAEAPIRDNDNGIGGISSGNDLNSGGGGIGTGTREYVFGSNPDVAPDGSAATGAIQETESGRDIDTLPDQTRRYDDDGRTSDATERNADTNSSGNLYQENERGDRTGIVSNYQIDYASFTASHKVFNKKRKYQANTDAINLLVTLLIEKRQATSVEQHVLANYVGFGGLKEILLDPTKDQHWGVASDADLRSNVAEVFISIAKLSEIVGEDLLRSCRESIESAFYTSADVVQAIYYTIDKIGFKQGAILEPSAGVGNFLGLMPKEMAEKSKITGIELDKISGNILAQLYPTANVYKQRYEVTPLPEKSYDLVISNVPFGRITIFDRSLHTNRNTKYNEASNNIHNYYFAKSLFLAKENGLIAFVTSRYTLDSTKNNAIRELIAEEAEFLGAIRLGDNAFKGNAGTQVVTDIIFLRKFEIGEAKVQKFNFKNTQSIDFTDANDVSGKLIYNEYFHENPQHLLGTIEFGGQLNNVSFNLKGDKGVSYFEAITKIADQLFPQPILKEGIAKADKPVHFLDANFYVPGKFDSFGNLVKMTNGKIGNYTPEFYVNPIIENDLQLKNPGLNTDKFRSGNYDEYDIQTINASGYAVSDFLNRSVQIAKLKKEDVLKVDGYIAMRNSLKSIIFYESNGYDDNFITEERTKLKKEYNQFIGRFGNIISNRNAGFKKYDPVDYNLLASLEKVDSVTKIVLQADILEKRTIAPMVFIEAAATLEDAINISLAEFGFANMHRISSLLNKDADVILAEQDSENQQLFENPNSISPDDAYIVRAEYLSGEVVEKLRLAEVAANNDPLYQVNVTALQGAQPQKIEAVDIYSPMHASWMPIRFLTEFVEELTGVGRISIIHSKGLNKNELKINGYNGKLQKLSTIRKGAEWVVSHAINGTDPAITYTVKDGDNVKTVHDAVDSATAKEICKTINESWDKWKFESSERRAEITTIYNAKFNTAVLRDYTGAGKHIDLPGLIGYQARDHQKDAIFRFTQTMGGIADHMVGAGKTLIQVCTAMELKRLGRVNKPCIIGLKSQVPQFYKEFKTAYPLANVLFPSENDYSKANRPKLLNSIATNNWDCIILSHEQFGQIEQPVEIKLDLIRELMSNIHDEILESEDKKTIGKLETRLKNYQVKIDKLLTIEKDVNVLDFKQLGIDFLIVDECQEFKNLEFTTQKSNVRGLGNPNGSKRAFNMLVACRYLQKHHSSDKGILFCSGTPISNSMAELYLLFKYLTPAKLEKQGFTTFDAWASNYANSYAELEYSLGKFKSITRFREFVNLPELIGDYRAIADVRNNNNLKLEKPVGVHELFKVEPNATQLMLIQKIMAFIDTKGNKNREELGLTNGYSSEREMNPTYGLLATNFAKKLSLDPRLINANLEGGSKIPAIVEDVVKTFEATTDFLGTQLIFCDIGTPKSVNSVENLFNYLEEIEIPVTDIVAIFGEDSMENGKFESLTKVVEKMKTTLGYSDQDCAEVIADANQLQKFNVYSEIKSCLIKKGIPEDQVKFIHDYKTRLQKEDLYKEMNDGTVRILIGSTRKMGTGLNVQAKICSLIHADVCWKPSDMEQRNGRGERQGNLVAKNFLDNRLPIKYFATNRTLDASMYNVVNLKAKFITQLKVENVTARTMKDVGEEGVDMGSFSAELSGDPIHKEKATLTKRVAELMLLKSSHRNVIHQNEDNIRQQTKLIPFYEEKIAGLTLSLPLVHNIPKEFEPNAMNLRDQNDLVDLVGNYGIVKKAINEITTHPDYERSADPILIKVDLRDHVDNLVKVTLEVPMKMEDKFVAIVDNIEYNRLGDAGNAILGHVGTLKLNHHFYTDKKVAQVWGFDVVCSTVGAFSEHVSRSVKTPGGTVVGVDKHLSLGDTAITMQIRAAILNIPFEIKTLEEKLIDSKINLETFKLAQGGEFKYADELLRSSTRLSEVDNIIVKMIEEESKQQQQGNDDLGEDGNDIDIDPDDEPTLKPKGQKL